MSTFEDMDTDETTGKEPHPNDVLLNRRATAKHQQELGLHLDTTDHSPLDASSSRACTSPSASVAGHTVVSTYGNDVVRFGASLNNEDDRKPSPPDFLPDNNESTVNGNNMVPDEDDLDESIVETLIGNSVPPLPPHAVVLDYHATSNCKMPAATALFREICKQYVGTKHFSNDKLQELYGKFKSKLSCPPENICVVRPAKKRMRSKETDEMFDESQMYQDVASQQYFVSFHEKYRDTKVTNYVKGLRSRSKKKKDLKTFIPQMLSRLETFCNLHDTSGDRLSHAVKNLRALLRSLELSLLDDEDMIQELCNVIEKFWKRNFEGKDPPVGNTSSTGGSLGSGGSSSGGTGSSGSGGNSSGGTGGTGSSGSGGNSSGGTGGTGLPGPGGRSSGGTGDTGPSDSVEESSDNRLGASSGDGNDLSSQEETSSVDSNSSLSDDGSDFFEGGDSPCSDGFKGDIFAMEVQEISDFDLYHKVYGALLHEMRNYGEAPQSPDDLLFVRRVYSMGRMNTSLESSSRTIFQDGESCFEKITSITERNQLVRHYITGHQKHKLHWRNQGTNDVTGIIEPQSITFDDSARIQENSIQILEEKVNQANDNGLRGGDNIVNHCRIDLSNVSLVNDCEVKERLQPRYLRAILHPSPEKRTCQCLENPNNLSIPSLEGRGTEVNEGRCTMNGDVGSRASSMAAGVTLCSMKRTCQCLTSANDLTILSLPVLGGMGVDEGRYTAVGGGVCTCTVYLNWDTRFTISSLDDVGSVSSLTGGELLQLCPKKNKARTSESVVDNADSVPVDWESVDWFLSNEDLLPEPTDLIMQDNEATIQDVPPVATNSVVKIREVDVLLGRGEFTNRHTGNITFRSLKPLFQPRYLATSIRREKTVIAQELVDFIRTRYGSRFLERDREDRCQWRVVDSQRALEKAKKLLSSEQSKVRFAAQGTYVKEINVSDVLLGRGERSNRHKGNILFLKEKYRFQPRFLQAQTNKEKASIAQEFVNYMASERGSRFLAFDEVKKKWDLADDERVLEKAKQVLRKVLTPEQRRAQEEWHAALGS